MANELTAAQRALEILAEIEAEETMKMDIKNQFGSQKNVSSADIKTSEKKLHSPNKPSQAAGDSTEAFTLNINNLTKDDIINGFVFSELINKPLALRRHRRF